MRTEINRDQINVERLKEVLEFYKAFAQTFSKNLTLTYDLARRTVISRVSDRKMERVLNEVHQPFTPAQVQLTNSFWAHMYL